MIHATHLMNKELEKLLLALESEGTKKPDRERFFSMAVDLISQLDEENRKTYERRLTAILEFKSPNRRIVKEFLHRHPYPKTYTGKEKNARRRTDYSPFH